MSDVREALNAAIEQQSGGETGGDSPPETSSAAPAGGGGAAPSAGTEPAPVAEKPGRSRDEAGRFAAKAKEEAKAIAEAKAATTTAQPAAPAATATPAPLRPPRSWSATAREAWGNLTPELQAEVIRRERDIESGLREAAEARKLREEFQRTISPYEAMLRAEGSEPLKAVGNLLQTAAALRTAPPAQRAALVAQIVRSYGVPIDALDAALSGEAPQAQQAPPQYRDPRVDQLFATIEQAKAAKAQQLQAEAQKALSTVQEQEFFEDVREEMADILEVAARRGVAMSVEDAYNRAIALHPEISKVLSQREAAKAAANAQASTQRAKAASASVRGSPVGSTDDSKPTSLREQLEAAFAGRK